MSTSSSIELFLPLLPILDRLLPHPDLLLIIFIKGGADNSVSAPTSGASNFLFAPHVGADKAWLSVPVDDQMGCSSMSNVLGNSSGLPKQY